ncbi:inactive phospholipase D5 isoform X2 [Eucyclogobius newberryi]|uniref:inactive phospholipase D5 isoform X2 n=1 Tax=Eucyclogobius newberryi TaxID=166745 RepID=UPI003B5C9242
MELFEGARFGLQVPDSPAAPVYVCPVKSSSSSTIQQQGYSASIFLKHKEKLEKTQQKCIAIFALVCCFAVLVALFFSSVDIWGDSEDGITEENCSRNCRTVLVENIPRDLFATNAKTSVPLSAGFHKLLDLAKYSIEVVSPVWNLNSWDTETTGSVKQGQLLFQRLIGLKSRGVKLKIASSLTNSVELKTLVAHGAEVIFVNMTAFTRGGLHSSFWIVDRKHIYIGSGDMDWRSFAKRKELGVMVYNCSCLALDLHRVFAFYWQLHERDYVPTIWSKRVSALYNRHEPLELQLNETEATTYVSTSPELFCSKDRTKDIDAIYQVIHNAKTFIFISVTDYLPIVNRKLRGSTVTRYWSLIDEVIREAVVLRGVKVRMLITYWEKTHPLTFNFVSSLKSLCFQLHNCSMDVRFFSQKETKGDIPDPLNHNKYMVTDNALYIGNHNWVGSEFSVNAGVGLVIMMQNNLKNRGRTILGQVRAAFDRDWRSPHAKSQQGSNNQNNIYREGYSKWQRENYSKHPL